MANQQNTLDLQNCCDDRIPNGNEDCPEVEPEATFTYECETEEWVVVRSVRNKTSWVLTESMLSLIWDDVYPRVVTLQWMLDMGMCLPKEAKEKLEEYNPQSPLQRFPGLYTDNEQAREYLLAMVKILREDKYLTPSFRDDVLRPVQGYLEQDLKDRIPIRFIPGKGFDYIISSEGLELILPKMPSCYLDDFRNTNPEELSKLLLELFYELYITRETGKYAINITPHDYHTFVDNECTTDPGDRILANRTVRLVTADNNVEELQFATSSFVRALINAPITYGGQFLSDIFPSDLQDINCSEDQRVHNDASPFRIFLCLLFGRPITFSQYKCILSYTRCWQISGSVFRRIAHETPRQIARMWRNKLQTNRTVGGFHELTDDAVLGLSSDQRIKLRDRARQAFSTVVNKSDTQYVDNENTGCRSLFSDRLEISLPPKERMFFRGMKDDPKEPRLTEIHITKFGLLFPTLTEGPGLETMMRSWKNGAAANVMFTDSTKTS